MSPNKKPQNDKQKIREGVLKWWAFKYDNPNTAIGDLIDYAISKTAKAIYSEGSRRKQSGGKFKEFLLWIKKKWC